MRGINVFVRVLRPNNQADDEVGGASVKYTEIASMVRARIQARPATLLMRAQGLGTDRLFDAFLEPATTSVQAGDFIYPEPDSGPFTLQRFYVTGVVRDGSSNIQSPRAVLKVQLERWDDGEAVEALPA